MTDYNHNLHQLHHIDEKHHMLTNWSHFALFRFPTELSSPFVI